MTQALLEEVEKNKPGARAGEAFEAGRWREAIGKTFEPFANQENKSALMPVCCGSRKNSVDLSHVSDCHTSELLWLEENLPYK